MEYYVVCELGSVVCHLHSRCCRMVQKFTMLCRKGGRVQRIQTLILCLCYVVIWKAFWQSLWSFLIRKQAYLVISQLSKAHKKDWTQIKNISWEQHVSSVHIKISDQKVKLSLIVLLILSWEMRYCSDCSSLYQWNDFLQFYFINLIIYL